MALAPISAYVAPMGLYDKYVLPRLIDVAGGTKEIAVDRIKCLAEVRGSVLEVGFGTGHNLPCYPSGVEKVVGVDPSGESGKLAKKRIANVSFPVEFVQLEGEQIAAPDASFDSVVCTFSLCTIPRPERRAPSDAPRLEAHVAASSFSSTARRKTPRCSAGKIVSTEFGNGSSAAAT